MKNQDLHTQFNNNERVIDASFFQAIFP